MLHSDRLMQILCKHDKICTEYKGTSNGSSIGSLVSTATTLPYELRQHQTGNTRSATTVDQDTLRELFETHYRQLVREPDPSNHKLRLKFSSHVFGAHATECADRVQLQYTDLTSNTKHSCGPFDFVFVATDTTSTLYQGLVESLRHYFDSPEKQVSINDEYKINFKKNLLACGRGVWLLNGFEADTDDSFSYLALRTERVKESLLTNCIKCKEQPDGEHGDPHEPSIL